MLSLRQFCKKGLWVPVFPTTASSVRLSVACRIGRYPCSVTPGHVFPWVTVVPPEAQLTFVFCEDIPRVGQLMALLRHLYNMVTKSFWYLLTLKIEEKNLKTRLASVSFRKSLSQVRTIHPYLISQLALFQIYCLLLSCLYVLFSSLLFYFLIPILFISSLSILLDASNMILFQQWLYRFLVSHEHRQAHCYSFYAFFVLPSSLWFHFFSIILNVFRL